MNDLNVLIRKEWREMSRNYKLYWIPIVFIIFGIIEPVTNYYLPQIMQSVGNLPEGMDFLWPEFTGEDIFISLMGQYQTVGILLFSLAFMGSIAGERKSGTATLLYVRPLSFKNYFLSKWIVINGIALSSVWIGFLAAWYYIRILFNTVPIGELLAFLATYSLWIVFAVTLILFFSASVSTGATAGLSILFLLFFQVIDSVIGAYWKVTPWKLSSYAADQFYHTMDQSGYWMTVGLNSMLILLFIVLGIVASKKNASKTTV
ncbi:MULTISPECIES: ABC transporter permease subunit [Sporosarcina]|uniref:ABC transporter permease n=1 Tax=Sporosarcina contaminans TaxID=633403 RepID=A0ABW3TZ59_9BACL